MIKQQRVTFKILIIIVILGLSYFSNAEKLPKELPKKLFKSSFKLIDDKYSMAITSFILPKTTGKFVIQLPHFADVFISIIRIIQ